MRFLIESIDAQQNEHITDFYQFVREKLAITDNPILTFVPSLHTSSFGVYSPSQSSVTVATEGRHISDILRTFGHELVHHKQLTTGSEATLEELEYEANAVAGMLMRDYNKLHPEMFGLDVPGSLPPGTIADVGASHMGQDFPQTPTYESGIVDGQPMRPPYPIEMGEGVLSELSNKTLSAYKRHARPDLKSREDVPQGFEFRWKRTTPGNPKTMQRHLQYRGGRLIDNRKAGIKKAEEILRGRYNPIQEDAVINSAGAGNVAGIGIGPQGEPGVDKKKRKSPIMTPMGKRNMPLTFKQLRETLEEGRARVINQLDWNEIDTSHPQEKKAIEAALKKPKTRSTTSFLKKFK